MVSEYNKLVRGLVWRSRATGIVGIGWVAFLITWLFLFASEFDIYQNIVIVVLSLIVGIAIVCTIWMSAMKGMGSFKDEFSGVKGLGWRMLFSMIVMAASLVFFLVWFYFFAADFSGYQNLGIFIVQILVTFGILAVTWSTLEIEGGTEMEGEFPESCADCFAGFENDNF
jgi:hypothetical protein